MNTYPQVDLVLNNSTGGTVSLVEVKSYPHISQSIRNETIQQLESYAQKINTGPLRYFTILSTATGYIKDLKDNKEIEFDTKPILKKYLEKEESHVNPRLLNSIFSTWLRELSSGLRKNLTKPEHELEDFGFLKHIKNTYPQTEVTP